MRAIAIDPGLSGALWFADHGHELHVDYLDMPTIPVLVAGKTKRRIDGHTIRDWLIEMGPVDMVILEQVGSMPGEGSVSAFTFGEGFGLIQGLLIALDRPWQLVRPQKWTKDLNLPRDKGAHRLAAQRLFPQCADLFASKREGGAATSKDIAEGRADAALLCHWFARNERRAV